MYSSSFYMFISLPLCIPHSITCCLSPSLDIPDSFLSIPMSSSFSVARQTFLPLACLLSLLHRGILDFPPGRGSYYDDQAKRLTTCHEKIVECQGHKNEGSGKHVNHCVHPAFKAWRTGLPRLLVLCRERVGRLGMGPAEGRERGRRLFTNTDMVLRLWFFLIANTTCLERCWGPTQ